MPDYGTHHVAVCLADAACPGVEVAAERPREAPPSCEGEVSRGGRVRGEVIEDGFRTGDPEERMIDYIVGARR